MVANKTIALLNRMMLILISELMLNKEANMPMLNKQGKIGKCFTDIQGYASARPNSIFTVMSYDNSISMRICNTDEINDHTKYFTFILSESLETYQLQEDILDIHGHTIIREFDTSKI